MRIIIDGTSCEAERGENILAIARRNGIRIPTLCHSDALPGLGSCRLCMVEIKQGNRCSVVASCIYPVKSEIEVFTHTDRILGIRKMIIKLLLKRSPENKELRALAEEMGVNDPLCKEAAQNKDDCIVCGLCMKACEAMGINAISTVGRGITKKVSTPFDEPSKDCIGCGACAEACPTNAIEVHDEDGKREIWQKSFELVRCTSCGSYFTTAEALQHIKNKLDKDYEGKLCSKCLKNEAAKKLSAIYGK